MQYLTSVSFSEALLEQKDVADVTIFYDDKKISVILSAVLAYLKNQSIALPSQDLIKALFIEPCELEIYVTDLEEGRALNFEARGKDYATNILSYPSELPVSVVEILPNLPLGELIICHAVVIKEADEQGKTVHEHLTHLIVHGILHLLGFDHELGQVEQDEMEGLEIAILQCLTIKNPYE